MRSSCSVCHASSQENRLDPKHEILGIEKKKTMTGSIADIEQRLKHVLARCTTEPAVLEEIDAGAALAGDGTVLDSIALLEFVLGVENEFGIILDDESLTPDRFESLGNLAVLIQKKIEEQVQPS
jgi:acyl carrier protein